MGDLTLMEFIKFHHSLLNLFFVTIDKGLPRLPRTFFFFWVPVFNLFLVVAFTTRTSLAGIGQVIVIMLLLIPARMILRGYLRRAYEVNPEQLQLTRSGAIAMAVSGIPFLVVTIYWLATLDPEYSSETIGINFVSSFLIGLALEGVELMFLFSCVNSCCFCFKFMLKKEDEDPVVAAENERKAKLAAEEEERVYEDAKPGGTGLTAETAQTMKVGAGVGPNEVERKCNDVPFAIAFLILFGFVTGYGISGLYAIKSLSFCERVFPGPVPEATGGPVLVYDNCFTYLLRGNSDAGALCTSFGLQQALAVTGITGQSTAPAPVTHTLALPTPHAADTEVMARGEFVRADKSFELSAVSDCLSYESSARPPSASCIVYGLSLVLPSAQANTLYNNCLQPIASGAATAAGDCAGYSLGTLNSGAAGFWTQCSGDADPASCVQNKLTPLVGAAPADTIVQTCVAPTASADPNAPANCVRFAVQQINSTFGDSYYFSCVSQIMFGSPGSIISCAQAAGIAIPVPAAALECLSYVIPTGPPSATCVQYALSLFIGSAASPAYSNCISPLQSGAANAAGSCAGYALSLTDSRAAPFYQQCSTQSPPLSGAALEQCVVDKLTPIIGAARTAIARDQCLSNAVTGSAPASVPGCLLYGLQQLSNKTINLDTVFNLCISPILAASPSAVFGCATLANIPIPIPGNVTAGVAQCLTYIVQRSPLAPEKCLSYALGLFIGSSQASTVFTQCVTPTLSGAANAPQQCALYALGQLNPSAASTYGECVTGALNGGEDQCLINKLTPLVGATEAAAAVEQCLTHAVHNDGLGPSSCLGYGMQKLANKLNPIPPVSTLMDGCVSHVLNREGSAMHYCLRTGVVYVMGSAAITQLMATGLQKVLPVSSQVSALLNPACLARVIDDPTDAIDCLVEGLIIAGADFARNAVKDAIVSSVGFNAVLPGAAGVVVVSEVRANDSAQTVLRPAASQPFVLHPSFLMTVNAMGMGMGADAEFLSSPDAARKWLAGSGHPHPILTRRTGGVVSESGVFETSALSPAPVDFGGLGRLMCDDLVSRGTGFLDSYYKGLSDYVWTWRFQILKTCGWILFLGVGLATVWMAAVSAYAERLIRFAITMSLVTLFVEAAINFAFGNIPGGIIVCVYLLLKALWYFWIRNLLAFAAAILRTSLAALRAAPGPFFIAVLMFVASGVWSVIFLGALFKFYSYSSDSRVPPVGDRLAEIFLFLAFFWTMEVLKNILSVTISGVVSQWYYYHNSPKMPALPTLKAFGRALSTAFGSICLGSLLVAALKTFLYFFKKAKQTKRRWLKLLILVLLKCLIAFMEMFNMYAYVQVASLGKTYCESARETVKLMKEVGLEAIANDDIVEGVMGTGRMVGALGLLALSGVVARGHYDMPWGLTAFMMCIGFAFGFMIMDMATIVVEIASATLFVDFAIDPTALATNQPELHKSLTEAWNARHNHLPSFMTAKSSEAYVATATKPGAASTVAQAPHAVSSGGAAGATTGAGAGIERKQSATKLTDVKVDVKSGDEKSSPGAAAAAAGGSPAFGPVRLELKDLSDDFRALLASKPQLTKYPQSGNRGFSHTHAFEVTAVGGTPPAAAATAAGPPPAAAAAADLKLAWKSDKFILLSRVVAVKRGAATEKLKSETSGKAADVVARFFSVHTASGDAGDTRTELNLEAADAATAERWVKGFEALIATIKSRGGAKDSDCCCVIL